MSRGILIFILLSIFSVKSMAQDSDKYQKHLVKLLDKRINYRLLLPKDYDESKTYPLIFFLHGSGERGTDNSSQLVHGGRFFLRKDIRKNYPAIVVFPQCPKDDYWSNMAEIYDLSDRSKQFYFRKDGAPNPSLEMAGVLLEYLLDAYPVDPSRVYIGGLSMGGMGTFEMVRRHPGVFAAAFPICGGAHPATAEAIKDVSWWIFHGAKDQVVPPKYSEEMYKSLKAAGADVKFTLYPDANHNSWDPAFAEKDLMKWLFSKSRK